MQTAILGAIKVGRSNNISQRINELQTGNPYRIKLILEAPNRGVDERKLHDIMVQYRIRSDGEWFHEKSLGLVPDDIWSYALEWYLENPDWWKNYR